MKNALEASFRRAIFSVVWKCHLAGNTELEGTMAAISGSIDPQSRTTERLSSAWHTQGTSAALTAGVVIAVAATFGALWIGAVVAALFVAGWAIAALEGRILGVDEFAAISCLHAGAAAVLALSL